MTKLILSMLLILTSGAAFAADGSSVALNCSFAAETTDSSAYQTQPMTIPLKPSVRGADVGFTDAKGQIVTGPMIVEYRINQSGGVLRMNLFLLQPQSDGSVKAKGYGHVEGVLYGDNSLLDSPSKYLSVAASNVDMFSIDRDQSPELDAQRMAKFKAAGIQISDASAFCTVVSVKN